LANIYMHILIKPILLNLTIKLTRK